LNVLGIGIGVGGNVALTHTYLPQARPHSTSTHELMHIYAKNTKKLILYHM
jgi:hypothetical protein